MRLSENYETCSAQYNNRLFLWTQPQYYGIYQLGIQFLGVAYLEKAGGPMTESRSWTATVKEKARLTPPSTPMRKLSID